MLRALRYVSIALLSIGFLVAASPIPRVSHNPYAHVDWEGDLRLLTQLHDHMGGPGIVESRIAAYDAAGYDVLALMDYSGIPWQVSSWLEVRYPPENWLSTGLVSSLRNLKLILPSGEQGGLGHFTTPFLLEYIEAWKPYLGTKQPHQYATTQEGIDLAKTFGGMVFAAHPVGKHPPRPDGIDGSEIFSGFVWWQYLSGQTPTDQNLTMLSRWDALLATHPTIWGIAVNDWLGPWRDPAEVGPQAWDSGKTLVLSAGVNLESVRDAMNRGAMLAVRDVGVVKGNYPHITRITVSGDSISIESDGEVRWVANGIQLGVGDSLDLRSVPSSFGYVRAEVSDAEGSVVYTQPFAIRHFQPITCTAR